MAGLKVASLHIYPVKAMRAFDVDQADVEPRGLARDRRWVVVDRDGNFLTQRSHPALATINARPTEEGLLLSADGAGAIEAAFPASGARQVVTVWASEVDAAIAGDAAADWLSELLGDRVDLAYFDDRADRLKISVWTEDSVPVSFADAFPVLVANTASLEALNRDIEVHGGKAVPMRRFRPNIVIESDEPWAEDHWLRLRIGNVVLDVVKPSDRCIVTTTDQTTGARMGKEPLAALARLRRSTDPRINGVLFATNAVPRAMGEIRIGDKVKVIG